MRQMLVALVMAACALVILAVGSPVHVLADDAGASTGSAHLERDALLVAAAAEGAEEEEDEEDKPDRGKAGARKAIGVAATGDAQQARDKTARQLLKQVGLQLKPAMAVTSMHAAVREGTKKPNADEGGSAPAVAELDMTLACDGPAADVEAFFARQLDQPVVTEQFRRDRVTVLLQTPRPRPGQPPLPKVVQVLIEEPKLDARARQKWSARLATLVWYHVDAEKKWISKQLPGKDLAAFLKALDPVQERLENLLLAVRTGMKRGVRPMDLSADETALLVAEYKDVFAKFAPGPMPDTPRQRVEQREMVQKQTALAGKLFVRIHVTVSSGLAAAGSPEGRQ